MVQILWFLYTKASCSLLSRPQSTCQQAAPISSESGKLHTKCHTPALLTPTTQSSLYCLDEDVKLLLYLVAFSVHCSADYLPYTTLTDSNTTQLFQIGIFQTCQSCFRTRFLSLVRLSTAQARNIAGHLEKVTVALSGLVISFPLADKENYHSKFMSTQNLDVIHPEKRRCGHNKKFEMNAARIQGEL